MAVVPSRQIVEKMLVAHEKLGNIGGNLPTDPTTIDLNFPDILVHMTDLLRFLKVAVPVSLYTILSSVNQVCFECPFLKGFKKGPAVLFKMIFFSFITHPCSNGVCMVELI